MGPESGSCRGFHPAYSCQDGFWSLNRAALQYAAAAARQPYSMGLGPTVLSTAVATNATRARITATASDAAYGTNGVGRPAAQNVTAGRDFTGGAPGAGGTPKAMKVVGSGTAVSLQVVLPRQTTQQLVYVQARDAAGNWSPFTAVWVPALA